MAAPRVPNLAMDDELKRKILFTLLALVIYRVGAHIAAPGVNVTALADFIRNSAAAGFFGLYDALGGGLSRATVFALGIMPYISASIIFQLAGGVAPSIGKMQKDEEGKRRSPSGPGISPCSLRSPRPTPSPCSPNRFLAPFRIRGCGPGSSWS